MHKARLWKTLKDDTVECYLCNFRCHIKDGKRGVCGVRENRGGTLYSLNYGKLIAQNVDPVEKKPLFHFQPASLSYSIATVGCNFRCLHCQNFELSQMPKERGGAIPGEDVTPEEVVESALATGCKNISYTYTEPTIFFEFAIDCARLAQKRGLKNLFVTNGYMTWECIQEMKGLIDACNVDVKAFRDEFYKRVCGGARLKYVLESVETMHREGIWVEVTTLVIPGQNDSEEELRELARWLKSLSAGIPWHISAFYPAYRMTDTPPTPRQTLHRAREIGIEEGLRYVYTGNIPGDAGESTYCYMCGRTLIERYGFFVRANRIKDGRCPYCGAEIDGVEL